MQLTNQQLFDLLTDWETQRTESPADELRSAARVHIRQTVTIIPDPDDRASPPTPVPLRDISVGGVRIVHHAGMPRGKHFVILLPIGGHSMPIRCIVRHCEMVKQDLYQIGAQFESLEAAFGQ